MLKIGTVQTLKIAKEVAFGVYLSENGDPKDEERVLLPAKQVPAGANQGAEIEVFVYLDSQDRLISTTGRPKLMLGEVGRLEVVMVNRIGAFLSWGLERDLFLPFREQTRKVKEGEEVLVAVYVDKSGRLAATMNVYPWLMDNAPYGRDFHVEGTVYELSKNFGAFVAVDDKYSALIPKKELTSPVQIGEHVKARVTSVRDDGKLNLSLREKAYLQIGTDSGKLQEMMQEQGGRFPFNDKASPELIREKTGMSKNEFKRAVGHLLKEGKIRITEKSIELL